MPAHSSPKRSTDSSPSLAAGGVHRSSKRFIATWRNTVAIESSSVEASEGEAGVGVVELAEQRVEGDRLAEHRRGLGQRERRGLVEDALLAGQVRVQAVAQLVGEREHVAAAAVQLSSRYGWCDGTV